MFFFKCTENGYVKSYGTAEKSVFDEINEAQYNTIVAAIANRPNAEEGYTHMLRADNIEWELVELPPQPQEDPTNDEAIDYLFGGGGAE